MIIFYPLVCSLQGADPTPATPVVETSATAAPDAESSNDEHASPPASPTPATPATPVPAYNGSATDRLAKVPPGPSKNVVVNLINRLVKRGVLNKEDSEDLIQQAEEDAKQAKAAEETARQTPQGAFSGDPMDDPENTVSVSYIPRYIKDQMREEIRQDVMQQAEEENWAAPRRLPDWVKHWRLFGDIRTRFQRDYFPGENFPAETDLAGNNQFIDFNKANTGNPIDVGVDNLTDPSFPFINTDVNRQRVRMRARFGMEVDLEDNFTAGMRFGTGDSNSPVSGNQSLGLANQAQGGNFSKYQLWLDRAFIRYEWSGSPSESGQISDKLSISAGRFDNPFFGTTLMWANDLGFDGIALTGKYEVIKGVKPFITAGYFPIFNNDLNFATGNFSKFGSRDKWLAALQVGNDWKISKDFNFKMAVGYFDFQNIEGRVSTPYNPIGSFDQSDADNSRPSFAQKGNTYTTIRNIKPDAVLNDNGRENQFQYFGLASPFSVVECNFRLDYSGFDPVHVWVVGDYVRNVAWNHNRVLNSGAPIATGGVSQGPLNNLNTATGEYEGGNNGWLMSLNLGKPELQKFADWNLGVGYRHVESDCVVDGFNDSDFGGGGTNLEGYVLNGSFALGSHVWLSLSWMNASAIVGPPFKQDVVQIDLNAKF